MTGACSEALSHQETPLRLTATTSLKLQDFRVSCGILCFMFFFVLFFFFFFNFLVILLEILVNYLL